MDSPPRTIENTCKDGTKAHVGKLYVQSTAWGWAYIIIAQLHIPNEEISAKEGVGKQVLHAWWAYTCKTHLDGLTYMYTCTCIMCARE